jgi:hypothetical protein
MVTSKPMPETNPTQPTRGINRAPLNHEHLDKSAPWIRMLLGLGLIAYTGYTTINGVRTDLAPLLVGAPWYMPLATGLGVAVFLSAGEWYTSEVAPFVYFILLLVDSRYTQRQIGPWIETLAAYHLKEYPSYLTVMVSLIVSWALAIAAARYGEILLFGRRKKG